MLKIIIVINCDICGQSFDHIATSIDGNPMVWDYLLMDLEYRAERCCWSCYSGHHCPSCMTDIPIDSQHVADVSAEASEENDF